MNLEKIEYDFSICKLDKLIKQETFKDFYFISKTDEEISLVCRSDDVPNDIISREDGFRAFRIQGILDFSLIGILSDISSILANNKIGIFVVSTYNTDYIFIKKDNYEKALSLLIDAGYSVIN